ncbi:MAG: hypothetical protein OMM_10340 [Candidatus Magnetoglobus multicellularis str. Araruama]|uniref:Transposase IS801/IS1294 domain-containing protein n=1 Tax=Candidatus Magnetoglobus multicellularis str. Araruama TaxID=890399 RepID=A0A1V1P1D3_9BACT|nr:MAG: hypothetical protein OMM_10340 [Candidatus Magnetoglobus multicellularis str. Araruama]
MGKLFPVSDDQIISYDDDQVVFEDKNSETGKVTLKIEEFIRRLSMHSTPYNYHRIRNFGFLSNGLKTDTLKILREKLGTPDLNKFYVENDHSCKMCETGIMRTVVWIPESGKFKFYDENKL